MPVTPARYTRLISFTPPAKKPGELCRLKRWGIEIASYLSNHNSRFKNSKEFSNKIIKVSHLRSYKLDS